MNNDPAPSPEQIQARMKPWQDWMGSMAAQNKLVDRGNRLASDGKIVKPGNTVTDGPYVELKEAIGGYTMIRANNLEEATELAKGLPYITSWRQRRSKSDCTNRLIFNINLPAFTGRFYNEGKRTDTSFIPKPNTGKIVFCTL